MTYTPDTLHPALVDLLCASWMDKWVQQGLCGLGFNLDLAYSKSPLDSNGFPTSKNVALHRTSPAVQSWRGLCSKAGTPVGKREGKDGATA